MKKRDYELIRDGKFNMRAIMQRAWAYVKVDRISFKVALKNAWADAKIKMDDAKREIRFNMNRRFCDYLHPLSAVYQETHKH